MPLAYTFVLEELQSLLSPDRIRVKPMFGCHAVYVDDRIVFILRRRGSADDGVWVALSDPAHAASVVKDYPAMRMIEMFRQRAFNDWFNLPESAASFEEVALELCQRVQKKDARFGKFPKLRKKKVKAVL